MDFLDTFIIEATDKALPLQHMANESIERYSTVQYNTVQYSTNSTLQYGTVQTVQYSTALHSMISHLPACCTRHRQVHYTVKSNIKNLRPQSSKK